MGKKGKSSKVKTLHTDENRLRRIETEINKTTRKMNKLLERNNKEDKKGGIEKDSKRHVALKKYISELRSKL